MNLLQETFTTVQNARDTFHSSLEKQSAFKELWSYKLFYETLACLCFWLESNFFVWESQMKHNAGISNVKAAFFVYVSLDQDWQTGTETQNSVACDKQQMIVVLRLLFVFRLYTFVFSFANPILSWWETTPGRDQTLNVAAVIGQFAREHNSKTTHKVLPGRQLRHNQLKVQKSSSQT